MKFQILPRRYVAHRAGSAGELRRAAGEPDRRVGPAPVLPGRRTLHRGRRADDRVLDARTERSVPRLVGDPARHGRLTGLARRGR